MLCCCNDVRFPFPLLNFNLNYLINIWLFNLEICNDILFGCMPSLILCHIVLQIILVVFGYNDFKW